MSFRPEFFLRRTPLFDPEIAATVMGYDEDIVRAEAAMLLTRHWDTMRTEYSDFVDRWCALRNQVRGCKWRCAMRWAFAF